MSLKGSIHKWSDGIGYGAFIPTERAYFNADSPRTEKNRPRPSSEMINAYRRQNITAGIDTYRSDISYGKTTENVKDYAHGDVRAREAMKTLTSGEVNRLEESVYKLLGYNSMTLLCTSSLMCQSCIQDEITYYLSGEKRCYDVVNVQLLLCRKMSSGG